MAKVRRRNIALAALPFAALLAWRNDPPRQVGLEEEIQRLTRETQALRSAVAEARAGTFIDHDDVIVGLHQDAVAALLDAALPLQVDIPGVIAAEGVTARIDHATVLFNGGYGTVTLDGRAWLSSFPSVAADVHLSGGIAEVRINPGTGALTATIGLDTLDARPLPGGVAAMVLRGRLLHILNARARESISSVLPPLVVPLRVSEDVHLAGVDQGPLRITGGDLEVSAGLRRVVASSGRLWVAVTPRLGAFHRNAGAP